ncbi:MAG: threonylcarbamoyl-AMP synthase [Hyphomonadaceae bacterium]|nr:threonylcarbamoyl-AMP synthase [Hyphomonadaceae bacterium]
MKNPDILRAGPHAYAKAVSTLKSGGLVALPTETVYGLAADACNEEAVAKIFAVKGRPFHNPLITHVFKPADAEQYAHVNILADTLVTAFWPGPLTLVLPRRDARSGGKAGAGLGTIALRCPDTDWTSTFVEMGFKGPVVMPSANRSGHVSPTTAQHVCDDLGDRIDLIIDGGTCKNGIESTVLKIEDDHAILLRVGSIPAEDFGPHISRLKAAKKSAGITAPGMLTSHYAPKARVRPCATDKREGEAYLGFGPGKPEFDLNLSPSGDLGEAGRNFYACLRQLDRVETIAVAPIPRSGLGAAINDRLRRAAA